MPKFIKPFRGVPEGEIYPKQFEAGDECPPELEDGARAMKALEKPSKSAKADDQTAAGEANPVDEPAADADLK
ncbi:hypothetical protein [Paraburkholderia phenoliruptrix]|uniref:hypothetical protein n=1 Tax=Paraburkholderia phenoliruptrix TaxID=252970 RepID=UPI001C4EB6EA|nr:hypothetical protein [Paraburkholderia phenoliruptrix]MBW0450848.1 hypothetical protein [Paraburkholderia phenoliruptrix]MBW9100941.1 hypothetical protein [Paraburkholderia phenoliruptrix]